MSKINKTIPTNSMAADFSSGINIDTMTIKKSEFVTDQQYEISKNSHRDEGHTFHILEKGTLHIEIDFQKHVVTAPSVVYMHPSQVHLILEFEDITVSSVAIKSEDLSAGYLEVLEDIFPAKPLRLTEETHSTVSNIFLLCLKFSTQKTNLLYHPLLRDSCNTLVAFLTSQFICQQKSAIHLSRFETIALAFKKRLEESFRIDKRPAAYADKLNISTPYMNECVKTATGVSVSKNIHNRIILEAKRLLYHTDKSVKEIALELGYEDYPYFSKLFTKITGMSALAFRRKNHD